MRSLSRRKLMILLLSLLVVASGAYIVLRSIPQSPMLFYFKAEAQKITGFTDKLKSDYRKLHEEKKTYMKEPIRTKTEVFWDIKPESKQDAFGIADYLDIINKLSFVADSSINRNANKVHSDISLNLEGVPIVAGRYMKNMNSIYLNVPTVFRDKYIKADIANIGQVFENLELPAIAKDTETFFEFGAEEDPVPPSRFDEIIDTLLKRLGIEVVAYIDEDDIKFRKVNDAEIALWGSGIKKVEVSLSPEKVKGILISAADIAKEEGLFDIPEFYIRLLTYNPGIKFSKITEPAIAQIKDYLDAIEFDGGFIMEVVIDKQGNIVLRDAVLKFRELRTGKLFRAELVTLSKKATLMVYEMLDSGESLLLSFNISKETINDDNIEILKAGLDAAVGEGLGLHGYFETEKKPSDQVGSTESSTKYEIVFSTTGMGADSASDNRISGRIDIAKSVDEKHRINYKDMKMDVDVDIPAMGQDGKAFLTFSISREDMLGIADFDLPSLDGMEIVDLNNLTGEELEQLRKDIMMSIGLIMLGSGAFTF